MKQPKELDDVAAKFFQRHTKRLRLEGLLLESTFDSWVLLCKTYSILSRHDADNPADKMAIIKFVALSRQYQSLAKGFGMHSDKPKVATGSEEKDAFGI